MGRVTIELSDDIIRKATMLAALKGVPLPTFLSYQVDELIAANDRYERARASVRSMYPDMDGGLSATSESDQFFDRWRGRSH